MGKYDYKYVVIGSGAAGTTAALMAAKAGIKTAIVEAGKWGGATLNARDVPYGAALKFAHSYFDAVAGTRFGISSSRLRYNYPTAMNWRNTAIKRAGGNSKKIFEDAGIDCWHGAAHFVGPHEIAIGDRRIKAEKFLIATGSVPAVQDIAGAVSTACLTPEDALSIKPPKGIVIVGAGATGCELAQYFVELGCKVVLLEQEDGILPKEDPEVGQTLAQYFERLRMKVLTGSRVVAIEQDGKNKKVVLRRGGQEKTIKAEHVVLAVGSKPMLDLGLENAGVKVTPSGIKADNNLRTTCKHIFAAGDVLGGESSTERAEYDATVVTSNLIRNGKAVVNYAGFVRMTDTRPQIAKIGLNELECKAMHRKVKTVTVPLSAIPASNINDFSVGFLKLIADRKGMLLGATVMSPEAASIAQELSLAIRHGISAAEVASTPHAATSWSALARVAAKELTTKKK